METIVGFAVNVRTHLQSKKCLKLFSALYSLTGSDSQRRRMPHGQGPSFQGQGQKCKDEHKDKDLKLALNWSP